VEEFLGTVTLLGETGEVSAKAATSADELRIVAGTVEIGEWDLGEVDLDLRRDGLHLRDGDDELVFMATDQDEFAEALRRAQLHRRSTLRSWAAKVQEGWERIPRRGRPVVVAAAALTVLGALWPWLLVALLATVAGVALLAGLVTALDPFLAVRLPDRVSPAALLGAGLGGLVLLVVGAIFF
jgi:hypothetical protein